MQYLSLLLRKRSGTREGSEEGRKGLAAADQWLEKSADARSEKVQAAIAPSRRRPDMGGPDPLLKQWALMAVSPAPELGYFARWQIRARLLSGENHQQFELVGSPDHST
jgi:hypothetical protein